MEGGFLCGEEFVGVGAQGGEVASVVFDVGCDLAHQVHEVLLDHSNDVVAISDDLGVGEVFANQGAVGTAQSMHATRTFCLPLRAMK